MAFTVQVLVGLTLGVFVGLFFGELVAPLSVAGEIFIGLLQMTVLPYIVVSLVANLGRISWAESRGMLIAAVVVLALLLLLGVVVLYLVPLAFPAWETASFFSKSLVEQSPDIDLVALCIPANPFSSLADNIVPAGAGRAGRWPQSHQQAHYQSSPPMGCFSSPRRRQAPSRLRR